MNNNQFLKRFNARKHSKNSNHLIRIEKRIYKGDFSNTPRYGKFF